MRPARWIAMWTAGRLGLAAMAMMAAATAHADSLRCEWSASGDAGEAVLTFEIEDGGGAAKKLALTWMPARIEGVGEESDHIARPALALDYRLAADGAPLGPSRADVLISRYSARDVGSAPKLSEMRVRAMAGDVEAVRWSPSDPGAGEAKLAALIRSAPPARLTLDILDARDRRLASASFRIGDLAEMQRLAAEARAGLDAKLATREAGAKGCP